MTVQQLLVRTHALHSSVLTVQDLVQVLRSLPELFTVTATETSQMVSLFRQHTHVPSCPSFAQARQGGRRTACRCAFNICRALCEQSPGSPAVVDTALSDTGSSNDSEFDGVGEAIDHWWDLAEAGGGCDASAMIDSIWGH